MQIAPTVDDSKPCRFEELLPLTQRANIFPNLCLIGAGVEAQPPRQKPSIGHQKQKKGARLGNPSHFKESGSGIWKMFQCAETGNKIKLLIVERELLGSSAKKLGPGQVFSAHVQRYRRNIDARARSSERTYAAQPLALAAGDIQNFLPLPRPQAARQTSEMTRHARQFTPMPMVHLIVKTSYVFACYSHETDGTLPIDFGAILDGRSASLHAEQGDLLRDQAEHENNHRGGQREH